MQVKKESLNKMTAPTTGMKSLSLKAPNSFASTIKTETNQSSQKRHCTKVRSDTVSGQNANKPPCGCDECIGKQFIKEDQQIDDENANKIDIQQNEQDIVPARQIKHEGVARKFENSLEVLNKNDSNQIIKKEESSIKIETSSATTKNDRCIKIQNGQINKTTPCDCDECRGEQFIKEDWRSGEENDVKMQQLANQIKRPAQPNAPSENVCAPRRSKRIRLVANKIQNVAAQDVSSSDSEANDDDYVEEDETQSESEDESDVEEFVASTGRRSTKTKLTSSGKQKRLSHKCTVNGCGRAFGTKQEFQQHIFYHSKKGFIFGCSICRERFRTNEELSAHKCPDRLYRCTWPECGHTTWDLSAMRCHIRTNHFKLPGLVRVQRERGIVDNRDYKQWVMRVASDGVTPIRKPAQFYSDGALEEVDFSPPATPEHVPNLFGDDADEDDAQQERESDKANRDSAAELTKKQTRSKESQFKILSVECHLCGALRSSEKRLYKHQRKRHQLLKFRCCLKGCTASFNDRFSLGYHIQTDHATVNDWHCQQCSSRHASHLNLSSHVARKHLKGTFECSFGDNCGLTFDTKGAAKYHQQIHKEYICPVKGCRKIYHRKDEHRAHIRSHTQERPFKCEECGKEYATSGGLKTHRLNHSVTRGNRYRCTWPDCAYAQKTPSQVANHIKKAHFHLAETRRSNGEKIRDQDPAQYIEPIELDG